MSTPDNYYVYSTLSNDNVYTRWSTGGGDIPVAERQVLIYGGANMADSVNRMWTPRGVATCITAEQLAICRSDSVFLAHEENGFISVEEHEEDPNHVATMMEGRDGAAPLTHEIIDLENADKPDDAKVDVVVNATTTTAKPVGRKVGAQAGSTRGQKPARKS